MAADYRKKPVVIQAEQFHADHRPWPFGVVQYRPMPDTSDRAQSSLDGHYFVQTLEGPLIVSEGDWIIRGVKGEYYPVKPDIFSATYERVESDEPVSLR